MPALPPLITAPALQQAVNSFMPLAQLSSAVQSLQNLQGFNPAAFSSLTGSIQSALQGFNEASNIVSNFASGSPINAFVNTLATTGIAGSSVTEIANLAGNLINQQTSFLSSVSVADSFAKLSGQRPSVEAARAETNRGGAMQFPADLGKYWMALGFWKYEYSTQAGEPVLQIPQGAIFLPVPNNLQDDNQLQYTRFSMTENITTAIMGAAAAIGNFALEDKMTALDAAGIMRKTGLGRVVDLASSLANPVKSAIETGGVLIGEAINTHQSLRFVEPTMKSHTFQWKLIPSSRKEAETIKNIIKEIKYNIYPGVARYGLTFTYPSLVKVYLYNADKMFVFKPAFVQSFSVNYTPDGGPAFYKSGHPFAVIIQMQITENSVWTKDDLKKT